MWALGTVDFAAVLAAGGNGADRCALDSKLGDLQWFRSKVAP